MATEAERFQKTRETLESGVASGVAPGMVAAWWDARDPDRIPVLAAGKRRTTPSEQPLDASTPFDLASLSKVLATALLTAHLVDRGWLRWETPLHTLLPEYRHRDIQVRHLLAHTAGLPAWKPFHQQLRERMESTTGLPLHRVPVEERQREMRRMVTAVAPEEKPDTKAVYSDLTFLLLGFALEEALRLPLDEAMDRYLWRPLRAPGLWYRRVTASPSEGARPDVAATEVCVWRGGLLQGQVHDDNCWAMGGYGGHAGVFGTAESVMRLVRNLFQGSYLSREILETMWRRVPAPAGCERTLGWDTPSGATPSSGSRFSRKTVGHLGYTGTSLWIDLEKEAAVTLLTNRVHPSRENLAIREFRPRFHDAFREDLGR